MAELKITRIDLPYIYWANAVRGRNQVIVGIEADDVGGGGDRPRVGVAGEKTGRRAARSTAVE